MMNSSAFASKAPKHANPENSITRMNFMIVRMEYLPIVINRTSNRCHIGLLAFNAAVSVPSSR